MNKKTERQHNLLKILEILLNEGDKTQSELRLCTGLQGSTISYLISDLRKYGLIEDADKIFDGKVGKPGVSIRLNNKIATFLGIYLEDDFFESSVFGLDGNQLETRRCSFSSDDLELNLLREIRRVNNAFPQTKAIAIAVKGIIQKNGRIQSGARYLPDGLVEHWDYQNLISDIKKEWPEHIVLVENDANCAAVCYDYEDREDLKNSVTYVLNNKPFGIGIGLMTNRRLYKGSEGIAGEYFEQNSAIRDPEIMANIDAVKATELLIGHMKTVAWLLNPEKVIITGSMLDNLSDEDLQKMRNILADLPARCDIKSEKHFNAPARGVALMASDNYIRDLIGGIERRW